MTSTLVHLKASDIAAITIRPFIAIVHSQNLPEVDRGEVNVSMRRLSEFVGTVTGDIWNSLIVPRSYCPNSLDAGGAAIRAIRRGQRLRPICLHIAKVGIASGRRQSR